MQSITKSTPKPVPASDAYYNLGSFHSPIHTQSTDAQTWFDRGLLWSYAFNHEEAIRCFQQVIAHDPSCVMGYWGVAYAAGPNYNKKWEVFDPEDLASTFKLGHLMVQQARRHATDVPRGEQLLLDAIACRYPTEHPPSDFKDIISSYATAMKKVYTECGQENLDIITLTADALMNMNPRALYESQTGQPRLETPVLEIRRILEDGLKIPSARRHVGILHLYIHFMEMSSTPEAALLAADNLRSLAPDAGHAHHMPSHIDVLVGDYRRAVKTNLLSTAADDKYCEKEGPCNFYSLYRLHNYHSLIYAAMLAGQRCVAVESVKRMEATITDELLLIRSPPMADWLEFYSSVGVHAYIRFGMWEVLKQLPVPENRELYSGTTAMVYYGRAIAFAATGDVESSAKERVLFLEASKVVPESRMIFPNKVKDVLGVAAAMLDGELEYRRGNYDLAFDHLRVAIERDDALEYSEPWAWMLPTRHAYAALLLEQGRVEDAMQAYAEDLGLDDKLVRVHQHPNNVWALHGYHECLMRLGRRAEAALVEKQLRIAKAGADVVVDRSCFCRLEVAADVKDDAGCATECCTSSGRS